MDWENQPNPFRRYLGAPVVHLPPVERDESPPFYEIFTPDRISSAPLTAYSLSRFFELSLAISAWKQYEGARWALRCNPSSGNLHPTEGYLVIPPIEGIHSMSGVYHYVPLEHALERRAEFSVWSELMGGSHSEAFLVGLSSIHWREAWKYGERAFRYCQHDIGHALAVFRIASAVLGWGMTLLECLDDYSISRLFGLDRESDFKDAEKEHPDLICAVFPGRQFSKESIDPSAIEKIAGGQWMGQANRLSDEVVPWEAIARVSEATLKPKTDLVVTKFNSAGLTWPGNSQVSARQIIRQRRSATAYDGKTHISDTVFYNILSFTKKMSAVPWDIYPWPAQIHLCLFVHRVEGIVPGIYFLVRDPDRLSFLKSTMKQEFVWRKPETCPADLNLYLLQEGNFQRLSAQVSCTQEIAGQGAFSLGMISDFTSSLEKYGAWYYRRLFWECGMIGQVLYLAAEEAGVRGTGIGCYFDDAVHGMLGISDEKLQSLYHFTIGYPVEDTRLTTLPAYPWSK